MRASTVFLAVAVMASFASANLLYNGDFELGPVGGVPSGWTAWNAGWGYTVEKKVRSASDPFIFGPSPLIYQGDLDYAEGGWNHGGAGGIYQVVDVIPGVETSYTGVWAGGDWQFADWHETGVFDGAVDGAAIDAGSGDLGFIKKESVGSWNWESFCLTFTPTQSQITIYTKTGSVNNQWAPYATWYDSLGVCQVPEPATTLLVGTGLLALAGLARRR